MTLSRYEIKFVVKHSKAKSVLDATRGALIADPHGESARYRVTSMYFDSPDLRAYRAKVDGEAFRSKLRLRYYGVITGDNSLDDRPYFLELKYRRKDTVYKDRIRIDSNAARCIVEDPRELRCLSQYVEPKSATEARVVKVMESYSSIADLRPADTVSYEREAWQGVVDERTRLTFDRTVHAYPPEVFTNIDAFSGLPIVPQDWCVMEVKFNNAIPAWLRSVLVAEGIAPRRFSKYANALEAIRSVSTREVKNEEVEKSVLREPAIAIVS